jgi:hypothetical protein
MTLRDVYLMKATELTAKASLETDEIIKIWLETMARSYLLLAEQMQRNKLDGGTRRMRGRPRGLQG